MTHPTRSIALFGSREGAAGQGGHLLEQGFLAEDRGRIFADADGVEADAVLLENFAGDVENHFG